MKTTQELLNFYGIEIGKKYKITKSKIYPGFSGKIFTPENSELTFVELRFVDGLGDENSDTQPSALLNYAEYKEVVEILDDKEKEYLSYVIKPFRENVISITKYKCLPFFDKEFIEICVGDDGSTNLPLFEKGTMYKGMERDRSYTLEELGL